MIKGTSHCLDVMQFNVSCCSYHTASKHTIQPYMYIRGKDLLFKFPSFNYHSTSCRKLEDSRKGLKGCGYGYEVFQSCIQIRAVDWKTWAKGRTLLEPNNSRNSKRWWKCSGAFAYTCANLLHQEDEDGNRSMRRISCTASFKNIDLIQIQSQLWHHYDNKKKFIHSYNHTCHNNTRRSWRASCLVLCILWSFALHSP